MIELTLPDGRRCRLEARRLPGGAAGAEPSLPVVHCEIDGQAPVDVPLDAGWPQAAGLPPAVVDAIIRHFLME